jgi:erythromycin esterase-like protein/predicted phosphoribosyltransferase
MQPFLNRTDAGRQLASRLTEYSDRSDVLVLGLPRGGVPVAFEVASTLHAPLDVCLVRKLGVPGHPEYAMGAIAAGGIEVLSHDVIDELGIPRALVAQTALRERLELDRRDAAYRGGRPAFPLRDRIVILVDDGLATGSTMEAAILAMRTAKPARLVVAAPVGARDTCQRLTRLADAVVCPNQPEPFQAVGLWYRDFSQTTDADVIRLLEAARPASRSGVTGRPGDPVEALRATVLPLAGDPHQYDALLGAIGDARVVLLGEATHGTHEFYRERAFITRRLIEEKGFAAVAVEGDWPDAYRVNRYVRGLAEDADAVDALAGFERFPAWMWRNADVLDFVGWLRTHNDAVPAERRAGFYGLDLYSLRASMQAVLTYLDTVDPDAARRARARYACFDQFGDAPQDYGYATALSLHPSCERQVVAQLLDLHQRRAELAARDGRVAADAFFFAEQNARLVRNAEAYYRKMLSGRESWNLRDAHMVETLAALEAFLGRSRHDARLVVWAHNSHIGDARATDMHDRGEWNVGQLVRERYGSAAVLVGFTTHTGTVTAASQWDAPAQRKQVRPSLAGSYERLFHEVGAARFLLPIRTSPDVRGVLAARRLERAIGVLYLPESERASHYFRASLGDQFDFVVHIDETRAVEPLERSPLWQDGELAETYPSGL